MAAFGEKLAGRLKKLESKRIASRWKEKWVEVVGNNIMYYKTESNPTPGMRPAKEFDLTNSAYFASKDELKFEVNSFFSL